MKNCHGHSERSKAKRNGVEESRGASLNVTPWDPSTSLGMTVLMS